MNVGKLSNGENEMFASSSRGKGAEATMRYETPGTAKQ
jgi:hypothetical protein